MTEKRPGDGVLVGLGAAGLILFAFAAVLLFAAHFVVLPTALLAIGACTWLSACLWFVGRSVRETKRAGKEPAGCTWQAVKSSVEFVFYWAP